MKKEVFQLTLVSQNDPGSDGENLFGEVVALEGGPIEGNSDPVNEPLHLPTPQEHGSLNWFMNLENGIENAAFTVRISSDENPITVLGRDLPAWVAQNQREKTNQIYQESINGIFGYAQKNEKEDMIQWIYTITAGVNHPRLHPPVGAE